MIILYVFLEQWSCLLNGSAIRANWTAALRVRRQLSVVAGRNAKWSSTARQNVVTAAHQ